VTQGRVGAVPRLRVQREPDSGDRLQGAQRHRVAAVLAQAQAQSERSLPGFGKGGRLGETVGQRLREAGRARQPELGGTGGHPLPMILRCGGGPSRLGAGQPDRLDQLEPARDLIQELALEQAFGPLVRRDRRVGDAGPQAELQRPAEQPTWRDVRLGGCLERADRDAHGDHEPVRPRREVADRAAVPAARPGLQLAQDPDRLALGSAGHRAAREEGVEQLPQARLGGQVGGDGGRHLQHRAVLRDGERLTDRHLPGLRESGQVVAQQVDDHQVLGPVLRVGGQRRGLGEGRLRRRADRCRSLHRTGGQPASIEGEEELRRQGQQRGLWQQQERGVADLSGRRELREARSQQPVGGVGVRCVGRRRPAEQPGAGGEGEVGLIRPAGRDLVAHLLDGPAERSLGDRRFQRRELGLGPRGELVQPGQSLWRGEQLAFGELDGLEQRRPARVGERGQPVRYGEGPIGLVGQAQHDLGSGSGGLVELVDRPAHVVGGRIGRAHPGS
jgi:hypothetical protein